MARQSSLYYHFGGTYNKDYSILGSILGSPYFWKLPYRASQIQIGLKRMLDIVQDSPHKPVYKPSFHFTVHFISFSIVGHDFRIHTL